MTQEDILNIITKCGRIDSLNGRETLLTVSDGKLREIDLHALKNNLFKAGSGNIEGDDAEMTFSIPHEASFTPSSGFIKFNSNDTNLDKYTVTYDNTYIIVTFETPPITDTVPLSFVVF